MLTFRPAVPADLDVLAGLGAETYRSHFAGIWSPQRLEGYIVREYGAEALARSLAEPATSLWLLAVLDRAPIGFAKLNWDRTLPVAPATLGTELQKIYFRADRVGAGHGAAMLREIAAIARARAPLLWLDVLKSNARARAFYERNGFTVIGEFPFATDLKEIGMFVMARDL